MLTPVIPAIKADETTIHLSGTTFSIKSGADLPGQIQIDAHFGSITADTDASTITFDMSVSDKHSVTLGSNRTLAVSNDQIGQGFVLLLTQDSTGSRSITWWPGIKWQAGAIPILTTTPSKTDIFSFIKLGTGNYLGMAALNF